MNEGEQERAAGASDTTLAGPTGVQRVEGDRPAREPSATGTTVAEPGGVHELEGGPPLDERRGAGEKGRDGGSSDERRDRGEGAPRAGFVREVREVSGRHRGASMLAASLMIVLLAGGVAGGVLGFLGSRERGRARKDEKEASKKVKEAEETAEEFKGKYRQSEATWRAAIREMRQAKAEAEEARHAQQETDSILDFFKKTMLAAGRSGDEGLPEAFWSGGEGKDVSLHKVLDATGARVADAFPDRPIAEATIREMLGLGYLRVGDPTRAVREYERALALREATQGPAHPDAAACRNQLAVAYRLAGRTTEAARLFDRNPLTTTHADALASRAIVLLRENKPGEAELRLRECLLIRRRLQPDDWKTYDCESALGEALLIQKKMKDAQELLISGYEGLSRHRDEIPQGHQGRLIRSIERLVSLYEAWGRPDKADTWREELKAARARLKA